MTQAGTKPLWRNVFFNAIVLILLSIWLWQQNQRVSLIKPAMPADGKLQCVSYAPYYGKDQTPFIASTHISKTQIDADLKVLAQRFDCVRIYSVSQGLDYVPEAAAKLGMHVYLGAWIGRLAIDNNKELNLAIKVANEYPDTVKALIVGNEVLLRKEQTEVGLAALIDQAKAQTKVPVTYADVWEFWLKHPNLEKSVDFVTVHILPYWEDDPQPIEHAINHASIVMDKLHASFSKPILIGETGWPSAGRQRGTSIPSLVNEARYLREFLQTAEDKGWQYNMIEAVDQPWKRNLEGTVGGYWGLYDTDLQPKFDFANDLSERKDGFTPLYMGLTGLLVFVGLSAFAGEKRLSAYISHALLGASVGALGVIQLDYLVIVSRDSIEWLVLGGLALLGTLITMSMPFLMQVKYSTKFLNTLQKALFLIAASATLTSVLLVGDGRYRDFPLTLYVLPVLQLSIGFYLAKIKVSTESVIYYSMNGLSIATASIFIVMEPHNPHGYYWLGIVLLIAYATLPDHKRIASE
ncbi:glycoside hydrolase family 17 protein [Methyloradius palustris]|uniref:Endo-1,3-beta-glucanase btgC n=1 Tax=Methyloradius palustris TaxID=2778876 RepID=A0A8D5GCY7_9PROT|nr:beta-1,6-glucan synthase [Methyloradius palustris]BCM25173.1 beta-1,6-glucan synthase [Methyloradius palustris]